MITITAVIASLANAAALACPDEFEQELSSIIKRTLRTYPVESGSETALQNYHYVVEIAVGDRERPYRKAACRLLVGTLVAMQQLEDRAELYVNCPQDVVDGAMRTDWSNPAALFRGNHEAHLPIVHVSPVYPRPALRNKIEGSVYVSLTVLPDGRTDAIEVIHSTNPLLNRSAIQAVTKYKYKPCVRDGVPVPARDVMAHVRFDLD